jgi:hypothetical protein
MNVRPIFVVGSPRSGTTMIGSYLGSSQQVLNAGEYRALYLAYGALPYQLRSAHRLSGVVVDEWAPYIEQYEREVQEHARNFIYRAALSQGRAWFCDSFPRNMAIARTLTEVFPDALFVVTLRHYTGVIQSLLRLRTINLLPGFEAGADWVDPTAAAAAVIWSRHYEAVVDLPPERTIPFGFDRFCAVPEMVLRRFKQNLAEHGFPAGELDERVLAVSHANEPGGSRATVGHADGQSVRMSSIPSFDASSWGAADELDARSVVAGTDSMLRRRFPDDYGAPAGYDLDGALTAAAQASRAPTRPEGGAGSPASVEAARQPPTGSRPARSRPRSQSRDRGSDTPSADRPAKGR